PWRAGQTKAEIIDIIKNGRGGMPGYGKEINSEAELDLLAEQVLSFARSGKSPGKEK
ncbi:cytochrome c, partial [bacterium]|nr:cytochrome c [bacterium]